MNTLPICGNAGIEVDKVAVDLTVIQTDKARLRGEGTYSASASDRLIEMNVDWRTCLRLQTAQLARRRHIHFLTQTVHFAQTKHQAILQELDTVICQYTCVINNQQLIAHFPCLPALTDALYCKTAAVGHFTNWMHS